MMKNHLIAASVVLAITVFPLRADQLVSASFASGNEQVSLIGLNADESPQKPDGANVSGESWLLAGGGAFDVWMRDNAARMHNGGAVGISLGGQTGGAAVTISVEITFETPAEPSGEEGEGDAAKLKEDLAQGAALLGFYPVIEKAEFGDWMKGFTGIRVNTNGSLQLIVGGTPAGDAVAFGGTFDPHVPATLSYAVDTATGAVTAVTFGSSTATYAFPTTAFTKEATAFAGFGGSLGNRPMFVEFRNFEVSAKPL